MKRTVIKGVLNHSYQRLIDRGILFYDVSDYLLYFTIFCVTACKYKVRVLKLVQMPDHVHHATIAEQNRELSRFMQEYASTFAREYNQAVGRKGPLWDTPFGSVPKTTDKKVRTCLIYLDNNPVERQLVTAAEDYRWNYLAYGKSDHPFSEAIKLREASMPLRRALQEVQALHKQGRYLPYLLLKRLFASLPDKRESKQLTDYIIHTYSIIDHQAAIRYFGSYEEELIAAHATTGSEYDIREHFMGKSDVYYRQMTELILRSGRVQHPHQVISLPIEEKWELFQYLRRETFATSEQIGAFLHLPIKRIP